ncbi:hypothetical protein RvY_04675 [Ramazzottius varieornatus]|uniref:RRM domain-containing protein n=1 Tax=Ramazzottius varieornatus TaxID=947166 RepID=A0A1D1UVQ8_RAMVA|nr:hypothetical protein RvY_04675 [Ramazzottius varieornatus]
MGDSVDDDFEADGIAVDFAGPGENDVDGTDSVQEAPLAMDDDEGRVIDSVGPADDLEEFNQMETDGGEAEGEEGIKVDDAMEDNENQAVSATNCGSAEASSHDMDAPAQIENAGDDDGDYLEIMVSEKDFDDVGEIEGEAVSRSDSDFGTAKKASEPPTNNSKDTKTPSSTSKSAKEDKDQSASKEKKSSRKSSPAESSSSRRKSERIKQRDEQSSNAKDATEEEFTTKNVSKTEDVQQENQPEVAPAGTADVKDDQDMKKEDDAKTAGVETKFEEKEEAKTDQQKQQPKAQSPEIEPPASVSPPKPIITVLLDSESADWYVSIRNLAAKTTANDLKEKLAVVAPVLSCTIFLRKEDQRYAMVRFKNADECNLCVEKFNGTELDGNTITVIVSPKRKLLAATAVSEPGTPQSAIQKNGKDVQNAGKPSKSNAVENNRPQNQQQQQRPNRSQNQRPNQNQNPNRGFRPRSPIRPPNRSPDRNGRRVLHRGPSPHRHAGPGLLQRPFQMSPETDRRRQEFEERRRVMEWKRREQDRMRREEDLMRKKAEVETLRLEKERERLKLEREKLESERIQLERQKHRDREQLEREKRRREDDERRQRQEKEKQREREREKEREREREKARERERERAATRLKEVQRSTRDSGRDDRDTKKRRSAEPSSYRSGGISSRDDRRGDDRRPLEKLIVRTDSYQRRHVSPPPPPRRGPSPPIKSSGGRSEANDRFAAARGGLSSRDFDDRDRRDGPRFNGHGDSFRSGERVAPVEFGRRDGGREFGFSAPSSGSFGIGSSGPVPPSSAPYTPSYGAGNGVNPPVFLDRGYGSSNLNAGAGYRGRY